MVEVTNQVNGQVNDISRTMCGRCVVYMDRREIAGSCTVNTPHRMYIYYMWWKTALELNCYAVYYLLGISF